jgi:hypothetical protein
MKMSRRESAVSRWLLTVGFVTAGLGGVVNAAPVTAPLPGKPGRLGEGDDRDHDERRQMHEKLRNEVLDQMRAMRMWKLTEELKLDQTTAAKVFPILAQYDEQAREIGRERHDIAREVMTETKSGQPNDAKMRQLIDRLLQNQQKRTALEDQRFKALRPALSPLQQAKLLLLLPRLEDDFRQRIREAMMAERRGGPWPGAGPPAGK